MKNKVCEVGITDIPMNDENGKRLNSYTIWKGMLRRCYSKKHQDDYPTYKGCTISSCWYKFSNFKKWYDINYKEGFQIDKDILIRGNKIYSEQTCRFVPQHINKLLTDRTYKRGDYKIGVDFNNRNNKFRAQCRNGIGKPKYLGLYDSEEEAFQVYKNFKEQRIKEVAKKAYDIGDIDIDIYHALLKWEIL